MFSQAPKYIPDYRSHHSLVFPLSGSTYSELLTRLATLGSDYHLYARFNQRREPQTDVALLEHLWEQGGDITEFVSPRITDVVLMLVEDEADFAAIARGGGEPQFFAVPTAVALETAFGL